ncbi:MAG TPA: DUF5663 domain-containing protein [Candidatus Saccharibacteria bacterium]|nr:DUF5663 domain-containing protein [Candidatus Saccharibacteria bacterium]
MFQLDEKFLADVGLATLPEDQKKPFLEYVYQKLETSVGEKLSTGMSEAQLVEFESLIDRNEETVNNWLSTNAPDYAGSEVFARLKEVSGLSEDDVRLKSEYAATKWLEINRPDYRAVVAATLEELKQEIMANKDAILGNPPAA